MQKLSNFQLPYQLTTYLYFCFSTMLNMLRKTKFQVIKKCLEHLKKFIIQLQTTVHLTLRLYNNLYNHHMPFKNRLKTNRIKSHTVYINQQIPICLCYNYVVVIKRQNTIYAIKKYIVLIQ